MRIVKKTISTAKQKVDRIYKSRCLLLTDIRGQHLTFPKKTQSMFYLTRCRYISAVQFIFIISTDACIPLYLLLSTFPQSRSFSLSGFVPALLSFSCNRASLFSKQSIVGFCIFACVLIMFVSKLPFVFEFSQLY